jgi:DDE domain
LLKRGLLVDHVTVWRWVQRYAPEMERRLRSRLKPATDSWRVDEMYIRVKGKWRYLYRAVDSSGATLDFLLSAKQDAAAARRLESSAIPRLSWSSFTIFVARRLVIFLSASLLHCYCCRTCACWLIRFPKSSRKPSQRSWKLPRSTRKAQLPASVRAFSFHRMDRPSRTGMWSKAAPR